MKRRFIPLPPDVPQLELKEFLHRLKHQPGFAEKMHAHYESMLALPENDDTTEMRTAARAALRTLKHHQGAWKAMEAMQQAIQCLDPDTSPDLKQASSLTDTAIDHMLDIQEPERTRLMAHITQIQATIRKQLSES